MGSSFGICCKECDYSKNIQIGIGIRYSPHNLMDFDSDFAILSSLIRSRKTVEHIRKLDEEENAVIADGYGHDTYRCPKCGEFYGRFFIRLDYHGGCFEVDYKCTKCRTVLQRVNCDFTESFHSEEKTTNLESFPCPKCGKRSLYVNTVNQIMWD